MDDEHRLFQDRWIVQYIFEEFSWNAICLVNKEKLAVLKKHNFKSHDWTKHGEQYDYQGNERKPWVTQLHRGQSSQQGLFHKAKKEADAAVEASYVLCEWITKAVKPFSEGLFLRNCMLQVADDLCPEKKSLFKNTSLSTNTVAERINE